MLYCHSFTLLNHEVQSALETVGLDPYVGFLHTDRPGRASLALDMMEELRAYLADRLVLSLINRKQISGKGFFVEHGDNGIVMDEDIQKGSLTLKAWQKKKRDNKIHPYLNESRTDRTDPIYSGDAFSSFFEKRFR